MESSVMALPILFTNNKDLQLMQNQWSSQLNPVLANPANKASVLKEVHLTAGSNVINHKLGAKLQGWSIIRQRSAASIYDNQDNNQQPQLTLILISSADTSIDLLVF